MFCNIIVRLTEKIGEVKQDKLWVIWSEKRWMLKKLHEKNNIVQSKTLLSQEKLLTLQCKKMHNNY